MCAQVLSKFGTESRKQPHLAGICNGGVFWVQGYPEPGAGSNMASIRTRAKRLDDTFFVYGQ